MTVADTGVGLPEGFELDSTTSLGLQIVRTLVVGELGGRLRITPRPGGGTEAVVDLPVGHEPAGPDRATVSLIPVKHVPVTRARGRAAGSCAA